MFEAVHKYKHSELVLEWFLKTCIFTHVHTQEVVKLAQHAVDSNATLDDILPLAERVCEYALGVIWKFVGMYMCPGVIKSYAPVVRA